MASLVYNEFKRASAAGEVLLPTDDIRFALVMEGSSAITENDTITTVGDFSNLNEMDGNGYTTGGNALLGNQVRRNNANDRAEYDADNTTWLGLENGAQQLPGGLLYKFVTSFLASLPIAYVEFDQGLVNPGGSDFTIDWDVTGILHFT